MTKINLIDFFEFYSSEPQQKEGVALLAQALPASLAVDSAHWVKAYRGELPQQQQPEGEAMLANPPMWNTTASWITPAVKASVSALAAAARWLPSSLPDLKIMIITKTAEIWNSTDPSAQYVA